MSMVIDWWNSLTKRDKQELANIHFPTFIGEAGSKINTDFTDFEYQRIAYIYRQTDRRIYS